MTRYLLDTNIISDITKRAPSPAVAQWLTAQHDTDLYISTFSLAEVRRGILQMPYGQRRETLKAWFEGPRGPMTIFPDRILPFDNGAAEEWAVIMAEGHRTGRPRSPLDMIIAATARAGNCTVVTCNARHFRDVVEIVDPTQAL